LAVAAFELLSSLFAEDITLTVLTDAWQLYHKTRKNIQINIKITRIYVLKLFFILF